MKCTEQDCNQDVGHTSPHGFAHGGINFAPRANTGATVDVQQVDLPCDICGRPLTMYQQESGGQFKCSCGQKWIFAADGRSSCTVLGKLFPSTPHIFLRPEKQRDRYVSYCRGEALFCLRARLLLRQISEAEMTSVLARVDASIEEMRQALGRWKRDSRLPFYRFWGRRSPDPGAYWSG